MYAVDTFSHYSPALLSSKALSLVCKFIKNYCMGLNAEPRLAVTGLKSDLCPDGSSSLVQGRALIELFVLDEFHICAPVAAGTR